MNTIEDRLRAATQAAADTVTEYSQPPLRLPARALGYERARPRIGAPRLIGSIAAATAIVAVVATVVVTRDVATGNRAAADRVAGAIKVAVPPYFVATITTGKPRDWPFRVRTAVVGRTATGRILATVRPPAPYTSFSPFGAVSAAADDRTFVLVAQKPPHLGPHQLGMNPGPQQFYELRLQVGHVPSVTLTALPIPVLPPSIDVTGFSLSPSGTRLAVQFQSVKETGPSFLKVYDLADGKSRTWSLSQDQRAVAPGINSASWVDGDRFLATLVYPYKPARCATGCVQLLDTTHAGGNILAASKTIFSTAAIHRFAAWNSMLVTPEGSRMILSGMAGKHVKDGAIFDTPLLYDIATRSGHVLSHRTARVGTDLVPLWVGLNGELTIIGHDRENGTIFAAIYGRHQRVPLRLPVGTTGAAW